jgi:Transposase DDE domain
VLSDGKAHDVTAYDELMEQRDSDPGAMLTDKGYDSDAIRQDLTTAVRHPRSRPSGTARCSIWSASRSPRCARGSNASSVISNSNVV